jgi:hypothetical protein
MKICHRLAMNAIHGLDKNAIHEPPQSKLCGRFPSDSGVSASRAKGVSAMRSYVYRVSSVRPNGKGYAIAAPYLRHPGMLQASKIAHPAFR